jgi:hypothetical protein
VEHDIPEGNKHDSSDTGCRVLRHEFAVTSALSRLVVWDRRKTFHFSDLKH